MEALYRAVEGVVDTEAGYTGGEVPRPDYRQVCSGATGHAEAVRVVYDPARVSYDTLLELFWDNHDPTQVGGQGPDRGDQYRSVIFFHTPEQEALARASKQALERSGRYSRPIATAIEPAEEFFRAEEYHQRYYERKGLAGRR